MVRMVRLIYCDDERRGTGVEDNPVRRILGLYRESGEMVLKFDTHTREHTVDEQSLIRVATEGR